MGDFEMKKIVTLFLLLIAFPAYADGPVCIDAIYDLAIAGFESADRVL